MGFVRVTQTQTSTSEGKFWPASNGKVAHAGLNSKGIYVFTEIWCLEALVTQSGSSVILRIRFLLPCSLLLQSWRYTKNGFLMATRLLGAKITNLTGQFLSFFPCFNWIFTTT